MTGNAPTHSTHAKRIAVLKGGFSQEREVSLVSGREIARALRDLGYHVSELDAGKTIAHDLQTAKPDIVFNALHGRWGEDGCIQGLLEWLKIPYTHSGVYASATAMDKEKTKALYRTHSLPVVQSHIITKAAARAKHPMQPPYVIKPINEGSSLGVVYIMNADKTLADLPDNLTHDLPETLMAEEYIAGRELTVTVLGDKPLSVTDIISPDWYDYHAKYNEGGSRHIIPADIPKEIFDACLDYADRAHRALSARGVSRTDFRWDEPRGLDGLFLLETNTQPGMTPTSLVPEQAALAGLDYPALVNWIVKDASCNR